MQAAKVEQVIPVKRETRDQLEQVMLVCVTYGMHTVADSEPMQNVLEMTNFR